MPANPLVRGPPGYLVSLPTPISWIFSHLLRHYREKPNKLDKTILYCYLIFDFNPILWKGGKR